MELQCEKFEEIKDEIIPLLNSHWSEIASHKDKFQLDPDWKKYAFMAKHNMLRIFTARKNGELIGYAVFIVSNHLHYRTMKVAKNDITFLKSDKREGLAGYLLLKFAKENLLPEVDRIIFNVKVYKDFSRVLEKLGFSPFEIVMDYVK